jgi:hypothetical protein
MLHFHKERMREINTIIRELSRQIYRGNDIDYIEIKTDVPEHSSKFCVYGICISFVIFRLCLLFYYNYIQELLLVSICLCVTCALLINS